MDAGGRGPRYSATPVFEPTVGLIPGVAEYRRPLPPKKLLVSGEFGFNLGILAVTKVIKAALPFE